MTPLRAPSRPAVRLRKSWEDAGIPGFALFPPAFPQKTTSGASDAPLKVDRLTRRNGRVGLGGGVWFHLLIDSSMWVFHLK